MITAVLPGAIQHAKSTSSVDHVLEKAAALAGSGATEERVASIKGTLNALQIGNFASERIPDNVILHLRDELWSLQPLNAKEHE